jgi:hypothetical protein
MNATKLLLLALCTPLAACDLLDVEDDSTSAEDGAGEDSGGDDADEEESGEEDSGEEDAGEEDPSDAESEGGDEADSSSGGSMPDDPPSDVPADLIGSWYTGNGDTHLETIDAFTDGTYLEERKGEGLVDGCYTRYTWQMGGEYVVTGDVIELQPTTSHLWVDACGTVEESDEVPAPGVFDFQLGADEWGYTLRLTPEGGAWKDSILYHRL